MVARRVVLLGLLAAGAALAQESRPTFLTHEELKALLSGTRIVQFNTGRSRGTGIYAQDGTAQVDWGTGGAKGTWRIDGDKFCTTYPGLRRGYETCNNLQKTGERSYTLFFTSDGSLNGTWQIEK
jgi:hypothetical protein